MGQQYDVYLLHEPHLPRKGEYFELVCSFEDGYASFLSPLFQTLNEEIDRNLVFDDGAMFGRADLKWLSHVIANARQRMKAKGDSWDVFCGYTTVSKGKGKGRARHDIYFRVTKHKMNALLGIVEETIQRAKADNTYVAFNFWGGGG